MKRATLVSEEETLLIKFMLMQRARPRDVKAGLQRLCALYETGQKLADPQEIRTHVCYNFWNANPLVRRWAYKAIALLGGDASEIERIVAALKHDENDHENRTWAMAAIVRLSHVESIRELCDKQGVEFSEQMLLAARLYSLPSWLKHSACPTIKVDTADDLTLKWACLLGGYDKAPPNLFDPSFDNRVLLRKLNGHPAPEVSEYSIWALWKNPMFGWRDLEHRVDAISQQPENCRRWISRLYAKDPEVMRAQQEIFEQLSRDQAFVSREGLALGLRQIFLPELEDEILDWYGREPETDIKILLVEHMAAGPNPSADYCTIVTDTYKSCGSDVKNRLLSAAAGNPLYRKLKAGKAAPLQIYAPNSLFAETAHMTGPTFSAGRDINVQNLAVGDMINSANAAVQELQSPTDAQILASVLQFAKVTTELGDERRGKLAEEVKAVATSRNSDSVGSLLKTLKQYAELGSLGTGAVEQLRHLIESIGSLIT